MKTINLDEYMTVTLRKDWMLVLHSADGSRTMLRLPSNGSVREEKWKNRTTLRFGPLHRSTFALESTQGLTVSIMALLVEGRKLNDDIRLKHKDWLPYLGGPVPSANDQFATVGGG